MLPPRKTLKMHFMKLNASSTIFYNLFVFDMILEM